MVCIVYPPASDIKIQTGRLHYDPFHAYKRSYRRNNDQAYCGQDQTLQQGFCKGSSDKTPRTLFFPFRAYDSFICRHNRYVYHDADTFFTRSVLCLFDRFFKNVRPRPLSDRCHSRSFSRNNLRNSCRYRFAVYTVLSVIKNDPTGRCFCCRDFYF